MFDIERADYYREYDLNNCRKQKSNMPEATHQKETITKLNHWFNSKEYPSGAIIALPTGSGKTFTAVRFLCKKVLAENYKVLWLAHTHHLLEQAYFSFGPLSEKINEGYEVGWIPEPRETLNVRVVSGTQNHFDIKHIKPSDDVLIATLQSISNANKKNHPNFKEFLKSANDKLFVVFDEAHHAPAPTYRNLIMSLRKKFPQLYLLGLTATPTYMDINKRGWLRELFPQEILYQTTVEDLIAQRILAKPVIKEPETDFTPEFDERKYLKWVNSNTDLPQPIVTQLAKNHARNRKITEYYIDNKDIYNKTIIFADRHEQCDVISKFLNKSDISADVMYAQQGNERNAEVLEKFRNNELEVLVNIKMLTEGTDVPDVDTVFITRQTTSIISMTQMVGRALRGPKFGGKSIAYLVFFQDDWQKAINWVIWDSKTWGPVTPDGRTGTGGSDVPRRIPIFDFIIPHLYDTLERFEYTPFLTLMPIGWYKINIAMPDEDGNPEEVEKLVMVFENEKDSFEELIDNLKNENLEEFDNENVRLIENKGRLKNWVEKFFPSSDKHVGGDILKSICDIARHLAQNMNESPIFIEFNERKRHDLDLIAQYDIDEKIDPLTVDQKLLNEYNKVNRYWKVFYYDYELFKSQYTISVEWILSQLRKPNIVVENKEKELIIKLNNGDVDERIEVCGILGDMGSEELLHEKSIKVLKNVCKTDKIIEVKNAAEKALNLINKFVLTDEEKKKIKEREEYKCLCCGEDETSLLQVDHIKPQYFKVDNSVDNLQTLCKICNIIKSTETIDFRKTLTNIENQPSEFLGMNKINSLEQWEVRNSKNWKKFLQRYINFFYQCGAVESIRIDDNEQNWRIKLHEGNNNFWLKSFIEDLTINIQSIRKEYGYSGPKELSIFEPEELDKVKKTSNKKKDIECSKLIHKLKTEKNDFQRLHAASKLGNLSCEKAIGPLIKALEDKDHSVRRNAAASLGKIGDQRAINPLIQMFKRDISEDSMRSVVKIGKPAVKELLYYINNSDVHVRRLVIDALGEIKDDSAVESLINSLKDKDSSVRWRTARALGNIGDKKSIEFLSDLKNDKDEKVREEIKKALKKFKNPIEILLDTFNEELKKIDDRIAIKTIKDGFYYYTPEKVFLKAYLYNSEKVEFVTYIGNNNTLGVKNLKYTPEWGFFFLTKEKENLQKALDIAKKSFELIPKFVKNDKRDKPGTYEPNELKLKLENYLSENQKTPIRLKNIVLPLCLEYDVVTRFMIKEKLVKDGEASTTGKAGVILTSISAALGRKDYLRQIITYERPYTWEKDNYSLVKEYRGIIKELLGQK